MNKKYYDSVPLNSFVTTMASSECQQRELILLKHTEKPDLSYRALSKLLKCPQSTVCSVLKKFRERLTVERKSGSGGKQGVKDKRKEARVLPLFTANPKLSSRDVARKVQMSQSYVQKVKSRAGLKSFKAQAAPNRDARQNLSAKQRARKLYDNFLTKFSCVVMDDETYIKADFQQIPGQEFYTATNRKDAPEDCKIKKRSKFPKKFLLWQAICSCGKRSRSFITTGTVNGDIYKKECLQKRLLPFLRSHSTQPLFWPDLASCHYSKAVSEWYTQNGVAVVPKRCNPPNCPELRPVEEYWSIMKGILKKKGGQVKSVAEMQKKWTWACKQYPNSAVQTLMSRIRRKARKMAYSKHK
jgi:transposase